MVSSDTDLDLIGSLIAQAGFRARPVYEHSILIESFIVYELIRKSEIGSQSFLTSDFRSIGAE